VVAGPWPGELEDQSGESWGDASGLWERLDAAKETLAVRGHEDGWRCSASGHSS